MRYTALTLLTLFFLPLLTGQHRFDPVAGSAGGVWLGGPAEPWCVLSSPALLALALSPAAGVAHFPSPWGLSQLSGSALAVVFPGAGGGIGAAAVRTGFDLFSETDLTVAYGRGSGALLCGLGLRCRLMRIARYGSALVGSVDANVVVRTGEWFIWGVRVTEINRPRIGRTQERARGSGSVALAFLAPGVARILLQAERDELGSFTTRAGIVSGGDLLSVRFGASGSFSIIHCGLQLSPGSVGIGYGVVVHPDLGWSHSAWFIISPGP